MSDQIEFLSAVIIVSRNPDRLAKFYREVVGIALTEERHGGSLPHYGTTLGDIHFAIHPTETFPGTPYAVGSVKIALTVFDMDATVKRIQSHGVRLALSTARHRLLHQHRDRRSGRELHRTDPDVRSVVRATRAAQGRGNRPGRAMEVDARTLSTAAPGSERPETKVVVSSQPGPPNTAPSRLYRCAETWREAPVSIAASAVRSLSS